MRAPNGFGSVHKIGGDKKRRKPWRARITDGWEFNEKKGKAVQKYRNLGYYETQRAAIMALSEYNKNPSALGTADLTFEMVYEMWQAKRGFETMTKEAKRAYRGVYNHSEPLHKMKFSKIKVDDLEDIMINLDGGVSLQKMLKTFWNQIYDFALDRDIVGRNLSKSVKTRDKDNRRSNRIPFTPEQIKTLWDNVDRLPGVDTILIMIYTGMRPSELLGLEVDNTHLAERYVIGGIKTDAGIDRVIPLHSSILPLVANRANNTHYLVDMPDDGRAMQYRYYLTYIWNPIKKELGLDGLTPHCCRHTFATLAAMHGLDSRLVKKIIGHSTGDITERYTHAYIDTLVNEVDKITI